MLRPRRNQARRNERKRGCAAHEAAGHGMAAAGRAGDRDTWLGDPGHQLRTLGAVRTCWHSHPLLVSVGEGAAGTLSERI